MHVSASAYKRLNCEWPIKADIVYVLVFMVWKPVVNHGPENYLDMIGTTEKI